MGLRVLVILIISSLGILGTFFNAFIGLITYAFWSYTYPEKITWGLLPMTNISYIVGLCLAISTYLQKKTLVSRNWKNIPIILFWIFCLISLTNSFANPLNTIAPWQFKYFTRVILITLIIPVLIDSKEKIKYYLWAIALFIGLIAAQSGFIGTLKGVKGGAEYGLGGPINDRNYFAIILCTILPIIFYLGNVERDRKLKILLRFIFVGDILALILTYSRGGFLGLVAVVVFIFVKSRRKILLGVTGFLLITIFAVYFIPKEYKERIKPIFFRDPRLEYIDASGWGRVLAWRSGLEMIKKHPIAGVGFYNSSEITEQYPDPVTGIALKEKAIHNTFLQVAAEIGLPAFFLYGFIFFTIYRLLIRIKKRVRENELSEEFWEYASMFQGAFFCFFVPAFFVNAAFIDISWHLLGLTIALDQITNK
jgi:probable O-glycosylation ligase (exosortase A-associated)